MKKWIVLGTAVSLPLIGWVGYKFFQNYQQDNNIQAITETEIAWG